MLKVASLFSQIPAEIPRTGFEKPAAKHGTEGHAKGFRSWTRFVAILFCHPARVHLVTRDMPRSFQIWRAHFKVRERQETRFQIRPVWSPERLPLRKHVFNFQRLWTAVMKA
jgi:hypothetical protein